MKTQSYNLFKSASTENILKVLDAELQERNESPIWKLKVVPFSEAILSVLIPLRDSNSLFDPEGKKADELTPELFLRWSDFVSLKMLYFKMQNSDLDISILAEYLSSNNVNLKDEALDFPISTYNLHQGVSNVIKSLL
ncbi:MAG: hypothetical protein U9N02_02175 [Campylobacterota bacterium]|nr:hypothetical protein [Campylobacterota bacterium]